VCLPGTLHLPVHPGLEISLHDAWTACMCTHPAWALRSHLQVLPAARSCCPGHEVAIESYPRNNNCLAQPASGWSQHPCGTAGRRQP
jgi:hypothetical protein